ncbi:MAG: hypothetical protein J6B30_06950 [Muribaculaceae bacterium]|nr:hypothetical protein [Muribaculaceae bacterium]
MKKIVFLIIATISIFLIACDDDFFHAKQEFPHDEFIGDFKILELKEETENLHINDTVMCYMLAPDESQISRKCHVSKTNGKTIVNFEQGLADGIYRLLYFEYKIESNDSTITMQYGLGCRIEIFKQQVSLLDSFDKTLQMTGSGTEDDPYIVTCGPHLYNLTLGVKDFYEYDKFNGAYFKQVADISLHDASYYCKHENGWTPIGDVAYPFIGTYDGGGHKISNIYSHHDELCGVGLFGHITNSSIQNLTIVNADISGPVGVGGIAGCLMTLSGERTTSSIINCKVKNSKIKASGDGVATGGLVGMIDMHTVGMIEQCQSEGNTITADYNAGGIVGSSSAYSLTSIDLCKNTSTVTTNYAGAGGIIGVADTLSITTSNNSGAISGAIKYTSDNENSMSRGTGGICGGSGVSWISGCENNGTITGYDGVGGIIGTTRLAYTESNGALYNSTYLRYCKNTGNISARNSHAGGLCGEAQLGCVASINNGTVSAMDHVGGIAGHTSLSVIHNSISTGAINGRNYVAGISALSNSGVYTNCQNYGMINATGSHAAGIVSLSGNNTIIHYCGNHNKVSGANSPVGGIAGEFGDPREWSPINIAEVVFGSAEIALAFLGPTFAVIEHAKNVTGTAKYIMKGVELGIEMVMKVPSTTLWGYGVDHLANPHHIETIETDIKADLNNRVNNILSEINDVRGEKHFQLADSFSSDAFINYSNNTVSLSNYLMPLSGNDETNNDNFFEKINDKMSERAEEIHENNTNKEIVYTVFGAASIIATTVCAIGATVASGGLAAGFIVTGTVAGVVGGINSISKGAADYTDNVVIISQCVNAHEISCNDISSNEVGGIVGHIYDRGVISDCLNTGNFPNDGGHLAGKADNEVQILNSLSLVDNSDVSLIGKSGTNCKVDYLYFYDAKTNTLDPCGTALSADEISDPNSYDGWDIGTSNNLWTIPAISSGNSFPVPFTSEMTK